MGGAFLYVAMKRIITAFILTFLASLSAQGQIFPAESNGASSTLESNSIAIQATIAQAANGGTVTITTPGTYYLKPQGANPYFPDHKYCLDIPYDNVTLYVGAGVTLSLASNQQTTTPIDLIVFRGRTNLTFDGPGTITGNARNQPWIGGYSQIDHGIIISGYGSSEHANSNITVKNLTLRDHFSNPVNIDAAFGLRNSHIIIDNVTAIDCGEGIQIIEADDVAITNCSVSSPNHVAVGDAIELSDVSRFRIANCAVRNHWNGSGFDLFGSNNGILESFTVDDSVNGAAVHTFSAAVQPSPSNITIQNGTITNPRGRVASGPVDGIELMGPVLNNVLLRNVSVIGTQYSIGIQATGDSANKISGPVIIENFTASGNSQGMLAAVPIRDLTIRASQFNGNTRDGIYMRIAQGLSASDLSGLTIEHVSAESNGRFGLFVDNEGKTVPAIEGAIISSDFQNNASGPIRIGPEGRLITVTDVQPQSATRFGAGNGAEVFGLSSLCPTGGDVLTFQNPSRDQQLTITACETRKIIDARQSGTNIYLTGGRDVLLQVGDQLSLQFETVSGRWIETARVLMQPTPHLLTEGTNAVAITSTTQVGDPFAVFNQMNFSPDTRTRISIFVANVSPTDSTLEVIAEDSAMRVFPLNIEHRSRLVEVESITQLNVLLPAELANVGTISLSVGANHILGNKGSIRIH